MFALGLAVLMLLLSDPSHASAGVLEINQACAALGCFPGDAPDLPVTIDGAGGSSFLLTGDLVLTGPDTPGIVIAQDHVTVNLGGFEIRGPNTCSKVGMTVTCAANGSGSGITAQGPVRGLVVRNGRVRGAGLFGIVVGFTSRVEDVHVDDNGGGGVFAGNGSVLADVAAAGNGGVGLQLGGSGRIERSTAVSHNTGFQAGPGALVRDSTSQLNDLGFEVGQSTLTGCVSSGDFIGIRAAGGIVSENTVVEAIDTGILGTDTLIAENSVLGVGTTVNAISLLFGRATGNTVKDAQTGIRSTRAWVVGNVVRSAVQVGILAISGAIEGNLIRESAGVDLHVQAISDPAVYGGNRISENAGGAADIDAVAGGQPVLDLGGNVCDGTTTCP